MKKILILGISGLVGKALITEFQHDFDIYGTYFTKTVSFFDEAKQFRADVDEPNSFVQLMNTIKPDVVISCLRGDFSNQIELHKQLTTGFNGLFYFCSTTNVFDGDVSRHHKEEDKPIAVSDYGKYKIACEELLTEILGERAVILRLPQIWGIDARRMNELRESIAKNEAIKVYQNLECNCYTDELVAKYIRYIMEQNLRGVFHLCSTNCVNQVVFTEKLVEKLTTKQVVIEKEMIPDYEVYYFGLKTTRLDIPDFLRVNIDGIIEELVK